MIFSSRIAIEQVVEVVLNECKALNRSTSYPSYAKTVLREWRGREVGSLTKGEVQAWCARRLAGRAVSSVKNELAFLSRVFRTLQAHGVDIVNPCHGVKLPPANNERVRYFEPEELQRMYDVAQRMQDGETLWSILEFFLNTGLRRLEAFSLRVGNVDLRQRILHVERTKTDRPRRLPLNDAAFEVAYNWAHQWQWDPNAHDWVAVAQRGRDEWLFLPAWGENRIYVGDRYATQFWAVMCAVARVPDAQLRDARHHHASMLAMAGKSLYVIGALLGHSAKSTAQTARYSHLSMDTLRDAVNSV